ncbi:MAG: endonuclease/exonuclease/phosphatase family protein [Myxococcales bacterium]|nr:endonuclease/exonuclease/phosphatase family protein [Myxococcales bacterium]
MAKVKKIGRVGAVRRAARARRTERAARKARAAAHVTAPHLCLLRAPAAAASTGPMDAEFIVATYNVHRWTGINGRMRSDPARAAFVIAELDADVIALQEVLRPFDGEDPLEALADALGLHVAFAATRVHKRGELGNAILSRTPIAGVSMMDLSFSRLERRVAVAAQFECRSGMIDVVATHLALGDRTRHRQVRSLLDHPQLRDRPTLLLGDMNAWRRCPATRALEDELQSHHNTEWPASFPAARPVLALDRIYTRGVKILEIDAHGSRAARRASDHLPIVARVRV